MSRIEKYDQLKDNNKNLMLALYGSYENFVAASTAPYLLEEFIFQFDANMGNEQIINMMAQAISLKTYNAVDTDLYLYSVLEVYLHARRNGDNNLEKCSLESSMIPPDTKSYLDFASTNVVGS